VIADLRAAGVKIADAVELSLTGLVASHLSPHDEP
jgi:hypothetical protein